MNLGTHIFIGYSLSSVESPIREQALRIDNLLHSLFPLNYEMVSSSSDETSDEVIYSISCPVLNGSGQATDLFKSLQVLLEETGDLKPYFCKVMKEGKK